MRDTWESGPLATYQIMELGKYKVKEFIFASSGSIYGLKKERNRKFRFGSITDYNIQMILKNY